MMISRRLLLTQTFLLVAGCAASQTNQPQSLGKLVIGAVAYGEGARSVDQYQRFISYLETRIKTLIELEPAYNEVKAADQIQRQAWSIVFAPPGLAAIAVSKANYLPIFPLEGVDNLSSVLVVQKNSPIQKLNDVTGQVVALGQPGSATGYYVPLYNLYGTSPAEVRIAPTPKTTLEWLAKGEVAVGALAKDEFERFRAEFSPVEFRILYNSRRIPSGSVLISPEVDRNQQRLIQQAMNEAVPAVAQEVGYIPNTPPPDYKTLISFIEKVKPIEARIEEKPAPLYKAGEQKVPT
ncbi:phosphate/phosphite/phosphonate ABC transporter substrate-binding protein [Kovacikia minuta CCNUW1]|uniref:phosphate/phosphite/phosphonate ABC transporter substrate-binding protein n=1 Tax=Kovacikia minuta TaxID=2931930 RepID=UPI001CCAD822|nr:PhnD/SsuA/transferrin family substrate-binding protein [Kovacikia minuta]UBF25342.1 phosphate/phosphite/phosphonate ABC transporter substrate-binding protein [Kovacikia minuta CCNUW1]